jgi:o-succinylbenzoate synthase
LIRITVRPYREAFVRAIATARGLWTHRDGAWVVAVDAAGRVGLGEVTPLPAWGTEDEATAVGAIPDSGPKSLEPADWGMDATRTPAAWAGLELALLDLAAQRAGFPLAAWLQSGAHPMSPLRGTDAPRRGGASPEVKGRSAEPLLGAKAPVLPKEDMRVAVNALLVGEASADVAAAADSAAAAGYRAVKLKVGGRALEADVARAIAVREAIGPSVALRLDGNGGWSREDAVAALRALAACRPEYVEQPVAADDIAGLVAVGREAGVMVAADEAAGNLDSAMACLEAGVPVLVLKPAALGGLLTTGRVARAACRLGARVVLTSALDRGVGTLGAAHLAAALGLDDPMGLATGGLFAAPAVEGLAVAEGSLILSGRPGLGVAALDPALKAAIKEARDG